MDDTKREILSALAPALVPLGQTYFNHRLDKKTIERQAELEQDIAEKRAEKMNQVGIQPMTHQAPRQQRQPRQRPQPPETETIDALQELQAEETCGLCVSLLRSLEERPVEDQVRGVKEYGEFKRELVEADDPDELEASLSETQILSDILAEEF